MTLVYLKLLKHATHHLQQSLSRDTWPAHLHVKTQQMEKDSLVRAGSGEWLSTSVAGQESKARHSSPGWQSCGSVAGTRASYTQICGGEGFLLPFSAGAWVLWLSPWEKITQKGWVTAAELGSIPALGVAEPQAALQWDSRKGLQAPKSLAGLVGPKDCESARLDS